MKSPSRGEYLLDLVLADLGSQIKCTVHPGVLESDHRCVVADVNISIALSEPTSRACFDFGKVQWTKIRTVFRNTNWQSFFENKTADAVALDFTNFVLSTYRRFIPTKIIREKPYKHPCIDEKCLQLVRLKHAAIGTADFIAARDRCTAGFRSAHASFLAKIRDNLRNANSKDW